MSDVLDRFPVMTTGKMITKVEFLDGRVYRIVNGVDFQTKSERSVTTYFYALAKRLRKRVRIHIESRDPLTLVIQARDR